MGTVKIPWANYVYYDESSPSGLRWKQDRGKKVKAGDVSGSLTKRGYWRVGLTLGGVQYIRRCHRVILELQGLELDSTVKVDHQDGETTNNRRANLVATDHRGNMQNKRMLKSNKTGVTGVSYQKPYTVHGRAYWVATWVTLEGKQCFARYSVNKHGDVAAKQFAINRRLNEMSKLKDAGAGYTARHGMFE